ncbi:MAG: nucleotidyltransferase family protein [Longimicrobiales bacterium]
MTATKAVILAAGKGTRMHRAAGAGALLDEAQRRMASQGLKGLIPFHGRPYLSYVLSALADAGFRECCMVVGPDPNPVRSYFQQLESERIRIEFAVQSEPLGSAHALLAAESFASADPFLVINADNYYPASVLTKMRELAGSGLAGFRREVLVGQGNMPASRVAAYALVTADEQGCLAEIVEKPGAEEVRGLDGRSWISMTCWRFGPSIFEACRTIGLSVRGEYEIPEAVAQAAGVLGERFRVVPVNEPVLDLSCQDDIPSVAEHLRGRVVEL